MRNSLLSQEELNLLLSSKPGEEPEEPVTAARLRRNKSSELERIERLEAALSETLKRIAFLEDQLSVRQSAAALSAAEPAESPKASEPRRAGDSAAIHRKPVQEQRSVPPSVRPEPLSRVDTYKRGKRWWRFHQ
ncbi:hypothetical protein ACFFNY_05915 [Paenibacillus hodogayensis]|uniref:Transposase TnpC homeodomain domain-containing protein n=1 Tax=Paenibacillus hodogayensis TaxID=279208 RepID=A0ABV5VS35_9BACL